MYQKLDEFHQNRFVILSFFLSKWTYFLIPFEATRYCQKGDGQVLFQQKVWRALILFPFLKIERNWKNLLILSHLYLDGCLSLFHWFIHSNIGEKKTPLVEISQWVQISYQIVSDLSIPNNHLNCSQTS